MELKKLTDRKPAANTAEETAPENGKRKGILPVKPDAVRKAKDQGNRDNLNNGLAFAYRLGDFVEQTVGNALTKTPLEAPLLEGEMQEGPWYRVPLSSGMAGDGSGYYIYLRRGSSAHLCIFFSGGGLAWNEYTAARPVSGGRLTSGQPNFYWNNLRPFTQIMNIRTGITDTVNPLNPFRDWNFVIVTYATGDLHVGRNEFPYTAEDGSQQVLHFHGYGNFRAAMAAAREHFPEADKLLIAGDSAGAFAVPALTDDIIEKDYPGCRDVTLLSDSGQLLYPHWRRTARDVWKTEEKILRPIHTPNLMMDWYHALSRKYGERLRYLYASSTHDYLLSAYYNDVVRKVYRTDEETQEEFFRQLKRMVAELKEMSPNVGIFLNDWKNLAVYPGLRGGTVHTAVRQAHFFRKINTGESMAQWLYQATEGKIRDRGMRLLKKREGVFGNV